MTLALECTFLKQAMPKEVQTAPFAGSELWHNPKHLFPNVIFSGFLDVWNSIVLVQEIPVKSSKQTQNERTSECNVSSSLSTRFGSLPKCHLKRPGDPEFSAKAMKVLESLWGPPDDPQFASPASQQPLKTYDSKHHGDTDSAETDGPAVNPPGESLDLASQADHLGRSQNATVSIDSNDNELAQRSGHMNTNHDSRSETKHLYRSEWYETWQETSSNLEAAPDQEDFEDYPLIARHVKTDTGLKLHSIVVNSRQLRTFLDEVFDGFEGISTKLKKLTFEAPFREFFRRWVTYRRLIDDCDDTVILEHIELLDEIIAPEIKPIIEKTTDLLKNGLVTYDNLWVLFEPGSEIYSNFEGQDRYFVVVGTEYRRSSFELKCKYIDCNGRTFGYASLSILLHFFEAVKKISDLNAIPTHFFPKDKEVRQKLTKRGAVFESLNGSHYRSYNGPCIRKPMGLFLEQSRIRHIDHGRIMIDPSLYDTKNDSEAPSIKEIESGPDSRDSFSDPDSDDDASEVSDDDVVLRRLFHIQLQNRKRQQSRRSVPISTRNSKSPRRLSSSLLVLCSPVVRGYCLTLKEWVQFYVDNVNEIKWNEEAFRRLVLPNDYKELILAFVKSQMSQEDNFDDVVQGKGKS